MNEKEFRSLKRWLIITLLIALTSFFVGCSTWPGLNMNLDMTRFPFLRWDLQVGALRFTATNPVPSVVSNSPTPQSVEVRN